MGFYLNPDNDAFQESLASEIYVDKSGLIAETNTVVGTRQKFICISRPRRFGKSMAAEMLTAYYCRTCDSRALFENLKIAQDESFERHLNRYDVLFLNVQEFLSFAGSAENLVSYLQQEVLNDLRKTYGTLISPDESNLVLALKSVYAETKRGFVIILDEWDCIFREKQKKIEAQTAYLDFLRILLKDQIYVKLAYMTGILPIKKYGTHSALNMFSEYSMVEAKRFAEYIGFTETEVQALCQKYHMDFAETRRWYDGYQFPRAKHIYSPKSVVDAMLNEEFNSYWTQTETYEALKVYMDMNYDGLKDSMILMLGGGRCKIDPQTFSNDMTTFQKKDDVLTLLVHLGYLAYDAEDSEVLIPNEEVRGEFLRAMDSGNWQEVIHAIQASEALLEAVWQQDGQAVAQGINAAHMETASILQYHNENALSCVVSLAFYSARNYYFVVRELPAGKGFADMVFVPRKHAIDKPAMIVELKWDRSVKGAIAQIKEKQYVKALEEYTGNILLVGINYDKNTKEHQCQIERVHK